MSDGMGRITQLLAEAQDGKKEALDEVMDLVYRDLRRIAAKQLARRPGSDGALALQPTELVHESFLKLVKQRKHYDSRGHFFAIASRVMMRVLLDHYRQAKREKRGGGSVKVSLSQAEAEIAHDSGVAIPDFVGAVRRLEGLSARTADVTKLRILWGLTSREIAHTLDVSVSTVEREWRFARRWLSSELFDTDEAGLTS